MTFLQKVTTPLGPGLFIAHLDGGRTQVALHVPASSMSRDDCLRRAPIQSELSQIEFMNWQKTASFQINKTFPSEQVTA